ncbi:Phosphorylase kinase subunit beta [Intoshia linei]|uniref:Phosphorylase b kinase regulatory subunit n=1 Tax=Intoshia linei TaxID=1819745 RepID=A0A177B1U2_9BILA|nr:Phosphorylase kinase subunit beta [Intoshia linei]
MFDIDDLHDYYNIIKKSILHRQNIVTGLVCHSSDNNDSWVRDNIYVAWALWSLSMAYDNIENDEENISKSRSYELRMKCVKIMRGLLICFMLQVKKVENFTKSHSNIDALHAKYSSTDFKTVVGDNDWGHLQFDAISLYILTLSQMIESNLNVIYDTDEVSFIQNLIFYIECCYRIPDYGIWERGDKNNQGKCELNTISIGMAYAALRSIRNVNLFGKDHSHTTKMYVNEDHMAQCKAILESMMPRESLSKEIGAGLLMIIGFPGFAVQSEEIINLTRERIVSKLNGNYGFKRFIRDGYLTPLEVDQNRLHYEKYELHTFENIECEWPLFYACMCINAIFDNEKDSYDLYMHYLEKILLPINTKGSTIHALPECYTVELDMVDQERSNKGSTIRKAAGKFPHIWSQSMYIIGKLLGSGYINKKNLDPLQCYNFKNTSEIPPVVICLVSLHDSIKKMFLDSGIVVETTESLKPVEIYFSTVLGCLLSSIGHNEKLGLTGRQEKNIGILETAKLYTIKNRIFAFYPHFMNISFSYISRDPYYLIDQLRSKILFLRDNWTYKESPIILLSCGMRHVDNKTNNISNQILSATKHFQDGQFDGARIEFGNLNNYLNKVRNCDITHVISNEALQHSISKYEDEFSMNMFVTNTEKNISDIKDSVDISNDILDTPIPTSILSKRRSTVSGIIKQLSLFQSERSQSANSEKLQQNISKCDLLLSISSGDGELDYQNSNNRFCMEKFNDVDIFDLIYQLAGTTILQEQADIVHYLVIKIHSAGILNMQMIFLGSAIGNILVRRKDITISRSHLSSDDYVISNPINSHNMALIISELCNDNFGMKMIFQGVNGILNAMPLRNN